MKFLNEKYLARNTILPDLCVTIYKKSRSVSTQDIYNLLIKCEISLPFINII